MSGFRVLSAKAIAFPLVFALIVKTENSLCHAFSLRNPISNTRNPPGIMLLRMSSKDEESSLTTSPLNHVVFEYCTGCRWMTRAFWMAQELLTTFNDDNLSAVTVMTSRPPPGARFVVSHYSDDASSSTILWDRAEQEGFPEIPTLKQLVRDKIDPALYLGHSDSEDRKEDAAFATKEETIEVDPMVGSTAQVLSKVLKHVKGPNVAIQYCTGCRWMLRSAYFGTELMTTFSEELNSMTLIPSRPPEKGGIFTVTVNGEVVFDRKTQGRFPEVKELKQLVRDKLAPGKYLGHSDTMDRAKLHIDELDDDDAAEMRAFYGVL